MNSPELTQVINGLSQTLEELAASDQPYTELTGEIPTPEESRDSRARLVSEISGWTMQKSMHSMNRVSYQFFTHDGDLSLNTGELSV